jgi:hypothetical protein
MIVIVLTCWCYAYYLYTSIPIEPTSIQGNNQFKIDYLTRMKDSSYLSLISHRTRVNHEYVHKTLDFISSDLNKIELFTTGLQISTGYCLKSLQEVNQRRDSYNLTKLSFPQQLYPLYGEKSSQPKGPIVIFISSTSLPLESYRQLVTSLRTVARYDGDLIITLLPSELSNPLLRTFLQAENVLVYPYIVNCVDTNRHRCLLLDSLRSLTY